MISARLGQLEITDTGEFRSIPLVAEGGVSLIRRIAHVVRSDAFAGVERYIASVAPLLVKYGFEVVAIGGDPSRMHAELDGSNVAALPAETTYDVARQLRKQGSFDIVHSHMSAAELAACLATIGSRARLVTTRHFAAKRGSSLPARLVFAATSRRIQRQIAISEFVATHIKGRSTVLHNGVANEPTTTGESPVVLMANRLESEKDMETALLAWRASGLGDEGWTLLIAGEGAERGELEGLVASTKIDDSVEFVGRVRDVAGLRSSARLFLATAPAEPFGLSVAEAMAAGLPVVAAAGGAHLETVGAVTPETLFPPGDVEACAKLLRWLAHDNEARAERSALVQAYQREHFSLEAHVARLVAIYDEMLAR